MSRSLIAYWRAGWGAPPLTGIIAMTLGATATAALAATAIAAAVIYAMHLGGEQ